MISNNFLFFRYYEGHFPILVTSDIGLIQEVFIKQYANFSGRKVIKLVFQMK